MKYFKLGTFIMEGPHRADQTVWLDPSTVRSVERTRGITTVVTDKKEYYSTVMPEIILKGLSDVHKINTRIVRFN